jgi:autotransporter translocation and assembly factor TamB
VLAVGLAALVLLMHPAGVRALLDRAGTLLGGELAYDDAEGRLLDAWRVSGLRYRQLDAGVPTGLEVAIGALSVRWRPASLSRGVLELIAIDAEQVSVTTPPPSPDEAREELPELRLPLVVRVGSARVTGVTIRQRQDDPSPTQDLGSEPAGGRTGEPVTIDRIGMRRLAAAPAGGPITIERLAVDSPQGVIELGGTLRPTGDYTFALDTAWHGERAMADGEPALLVSGSGTLRGSLRRLQLDQQVSVRPASAGADDTAALVATVAGVVVDPLDAHRAELEVAWSRLRWPLEGDLIVDTRGNAHVAGDRERLEIDGLVEASGPRLPDAELELRGVTDLESLTASRLELRTLGSTIEGSARVSWSEGITWSAELEGRDLDPAVQWPEWPGRLALSFSGSGSIDEARTTRTQAKLERVSGTLRGHPISASAELLAVGERLGSQFLESQFLESLEIEASSGEATLRLAGSVRERADLELEVRIPDLAQVLPEAGGALQVAGRLSGDRAAPAVDVELTASDVLWRGARLAAVSGTLDGVVAAGGEVHARLAVSRLDTAALSARDAELRLDGTLGGLALAPLIEHSRLDARVTASTLRTSAAVASGVALELAGTLAEHSLLLEADSAGRGGDQPTAEHLRLRATGGASEASRAGRWRGTLEELVLLSPGSGRWALDSELALDVSRDLVVVDRGCWRLTEAADPASPDAEPSFACGEARWSRLEPWSLRAELSGIPLGLLDPALGTPPECGADGGSLVDGSPGCTRWRAVQGAAAEDGTVAASHSGTAASAVRALALEGKLDGRVEASGVGVAVERARAEITRLEGIVRAELSSGNRIEAPFRNGAGSLSFDARTGAAGEARLELPAHEGRISAQLALPGYAPQDGRWAPAPDQPVTGTLSAESRDPTFLEAFLPYLRELRGSFTAALTISGTTSRPLVLGAVELSEGSGRLVLASLDAPSGEVELAFEGGALEATFERSGAALALSTRTVDPAGQAQGRLELPGYLLFAGEPLAEQALRGRIELALDGIAPFAELVPELADLQGTIDGSFAIAGTVGAPDLDGRADLRGFSARIPALGVELREGTATIRGRPGESLELTAAVRSGPGTLAASGTLTTGEGGIRSELKLTGTDVTVANTPQVRVRASPDLTLTISAGEVDVRGDVALPWARIELRDLPERAIEPSADIVRVDLAASAERGSPTPSTRVTGRIRLLFGDDFAFEGFGFDVEPRGSLLITETGRGSTTATGQLVLENGRYRAYGQNLEITEGRMLFGGGPIQNPALAVEAYRTVGTVQAGVRVSGNLTRPIVNLASSPAMPESDILHYMMLGRAPGSVTTAAETDLLSGAAAALGIRGGNLLARRLATRYDLDQLGIETEGGLDTASLVVGKYLSPRLYVSYGIGLLEPISTITLRYLLSSKWTLYAERGRGTGADLVYTIETGSRKPRGTPPP